MPVWLSVPATDRRPLQGVPNLHPRVARIYSSIPMTPKRIQQVLKINVWMEQLLSFLCQTVVFELCSFRKTCARCSPPLLLFLLPFNYLPHLRHGGFYPPWEIMSVCMLYMMCQLFFKQLDEVGTAAPINLPFSTPQGALLKTHSLLPLTCEIKGNCFDCTCNHTALLGVQGLR